MVFATAVLGSLPSIFLLLSFVDVLAPSHREAIRAGADIEAPLPFEGLPVLRKSGTATVVIEKVNGIPVVTVGHCRSCRHANAVVRGEAVVCGACGQTMARAVSAETALGCQRPIIRSHVAGGALRIAATDIQHALDELQQRPQPIK